ncbi:4,4'-diaponeurosporenoate glycosyltransferase [Nocardioides exalbidus]|uniref:4,4'-diaponeurosporenoate glycosyltransferase n=1 Tax=Nocardioides exalbidus TaxID=402596 RepID=A0A1H4ZHC5_9ACTN|nr:glycosyltransferase family 2 protein [Nocardioides exalbidus]SED29539.1 4,4'-diaponeurosporenoate glycosyltransferase [Nocardioides exalbidus]
MSAVALATDLVLLAVLVAVAAAAHRWVADLRTLPPTPAPAVGPAPSVSVVVPARDEALALPRLLRALAEQSVPLAEVVVVDDASSDDTAAVARDLGARVVPAGRPPAGWTGKAWACHVGAATTTGDLLLFLDADVTLAPDATARLLEAHRRHGGLVSVQPHHRVVRPYEQLSAWFNLVAVMASGAFTRTPRGTPMAFGPCLLTSRDDLARSGGHEAVRGAILDDAALAGAYDRVGLPVWCAVGGDAARMRSYPGGLRRLVAGWSKNIASGATAADPRAAVTTVAWVATHHAVAVGAVLALLAPVTSAEPVGSPALWAIAYAATALDVRRLLHRVGTFRWWTWLLFPVPLLAFDLVFARSLVDTTVRRSVRWRGREVDLRRSPEEAA